MHSAVAIFWGLNFSLVTQPLTVRQGRRCGGPLGHTMSCHYSNSKHLSQSQSNRASPCPHLSVLLITGSQGLAMPTSLRVAHHGITGPRHAHISLCCSSRDHRASPCPHLSVLLITGSQGLAMPTSLCVAHHVITGPRHAHISLWLITGSQGLTMPTSHGIITGSQGYVKHCSC